VSSLGTWGSEVGRRTVMTGGHEARRLLSLSALV